MTTTIPNPLLSGVTRLRDAGLSVLPIRTDGSKAPAVRTWKALETRLPTDAELTAWFGGPGAVGVGIIGGAVSGNLEVLDHDAPHLIQEWTSLVEDAAPGLLARLPQVRTPNSGLHVFYRCQQIAGNQKLAYELSNGKKQILIETRGEGGYVVTAGSPAACHPSGRSYTLINGDLKAIPTITEQEREILLNCARALNKVAPPAQTVAPARQSPGDSFNVRGDVRNLLLRHGWQYLGASSAGERWQRPGGLHNSATLFSTNYLYVFSSNAAPFDPDRAYSPFGVYTLLEHAGDFSAAARRLGQEGYGQSNGAGQAKTKPSGAPVGTAQVNVNVTVLPQWEQPGPLDAFPLPDFPLHTFPRWLGQFVGEVAHETQTPVEMAALCALSTLAAVFAPEVKIRVRGNWCEPLNLYTLVALPPAHRKSAVHQTVLRPLHEVEAEAIAEGKKIIEHAHDDWDVKTRQREAIKRALAVLGDGPERASKLAELRAVTDWLAETEMPVAPQYLADDVTPETLATLLKEQGGSICVASSEGGIFDQMAGRYSDGTPNLDVFLKGHSGDSLRINRRGRYETVRAPKLTIALCVQPEVLKQAAQKPGFRKRGLLGRFLYAMPESKLGSREIGAAPMSELTARLYCERVKWLKTEAIFGQEIRLSGDAEAALREFETEIEAELGPDGKLSEIPDWGGKLVGHTARLAGILHLAETAEPNAQAQVEVGKESVLGAIQIARCLAAHALAIFGEMDVRRDKIVAAQYLLEWLRKRQKTSFSRREIRRSLHKRFKTVSELEPVLDFLEAEGFIQGTDGDRRNRKPAQNYDVSPLAYQSTPNSAVNLAVNLPTIGDKHKDTNGLSLPVNLSTCQPVQSDDGAVSEDAAAQREIQVDRLTGDDNQLKTHKDSPQQEQVDSEVDRQVDSENLGNAVTDANAEQPETHGDKIAEKSRDTVTEESFTSADRLAQIITGWYARGLPQAAILAKINRGLGITDPADCKQPDDLTPEEQAKAIFALDRWDPEREHNLTSLGSRKKRRPG